MIRLTGRQPIAEEEPLRVEWRARRRAGERLAVGCHEAGRAAVKHESHATPHGAFNLGARAGDTDRDVPVPVAVEVARRHRIAKAALRTSPRRKGRLPQLVARRRESGRGAVDDLNRPVGVGPTAGEIFPRDADRRIREAVAIEVARCDRVPELVARFGGVEHARAVLAPALARGRGQAARSAVDHAHGPAISGLTDGRERHAYRQVREAVAVEVGRHRRRRGLDRLGRVREGHDRQRDSDHQGAGGCAQSPVLLVG